MDPDNQAILGKAKTITEHTSRVVFPAFSLNPGDGCEIHENAYWSLERVRTAVKEFNTEELMRDKELARHACYNLGAYRGPSLFLYDEYGGAIRHRDQLDRVLDSDENQQTLASNDATAYCLFEE